MHEDILRVRTLLIFGKPMRSCVPLSIAPSCSGCTEPIRFPVVFVSSNAFCVRFAERPPQWSSFTSTFEHFVCECESFTIRYFSGQLLLQVPGWMKISFILMTKLRWIVYERLVTWTRAVPSNISSLYVRELPGVR